MTSIYPPVSYPYNPSWKIIVLCIVMFGFGAESMAQEAMKNDRGLILNGIITFDVQGATTFYWVIAGLSASFVLMAILLMIRRMANPQMLVVNEDSIDIPHGALQSKKRRIQYSDIKDMSETTVSRQTFLHLTTREGTFAINRSLLPNKEIYEALREYLVLQVHQGTV